jgi:hypothetical protein
MLDTACGLLCMPISGNMRRLARKGFRMFEDVKEKIAPMMTRLAEMRGYL